MEVVWREMQVHNLILARPDGDCVRSMIGLFEKSYPGCKIRFWVKQWQEVRQTDLLKDL